LRASVDAAKPPQVVERGPQRRVAGRVGAEARVALGLERRQRGERRVASASHEPVVLLGRGGDARVARLGGELALLERGGARGALVLVALDLLLARHASRDVVVEQREPVARDGGLPDRDVEPRAHPLERPDPELRVAVVERRMDVLPEVVEQAAEQREPGGQAGEALAAEERLGEPRGELKVLGLALEQLRAERDHLRPVGELPLDDERALRQVGVLAARVAQPVVARVVPEVAPGRVVAGDGREKDGEQLGGGGHAAVVRGAGRGPTRAGPGRPVRVRRREDRRG
jgi:hypothetical protein